MPFDANYSHSYGKEPSFAKQKPAKGAKKAKKIKRKKSLKAIFGK